MRIAVDTNIPRDLADCGIHSEGICLVVGKPVSAVLKATEVEAVHDAVAA